MQEFIEIDEKNITNISSVDKTLKGSKNILFPDVFKINEKNVDEIFKEIQRNEQKYRYITRCLEYALKIRPQQTESICDLLLKMSKITKYTPSSILKNGYRNILIQKGLDIKKRELECEREITNSKEYLNEESFKKAIFEDNQNKLMELNNKHALWPINKVKITSDDSIYFVNKDKEVSYLQFIVYYGSLKCLKFALTSKWFNNRNLSKYAIAGGNTEVIFLLEQNGVNFDNCFNVSIKYNRDSISDWLLKNYKCEPVELSKTIKYFNLRAFFFVFKKVESKSLESINKALFSAAKTGNLLLTKYLIDECGAIIQQKDKFGNSPLHYAAFNGQLEVVQLLIGYGTDINQTNNGGFAPLHLASKQGHIEVVQFLVEHGAVVNQPDKSKTGYYPLHSASVYGYVEVAKILIEHGAKIDVFNNNEQTPLVLAAIHGNLELVEFLFSHGSDINLQSCSKLGYFPIHYAAQKGNTKVVQFFVDHGVNINQKEKTGKTPLHLAAYFGHLELVKYFIGHGANINSTNNFGSTPLDYALIKGYFEVVNVLIEHNADLKDQDNKWTQLRLALKEGKLEIAKCIAKISTINHGRTILHNAAQNGQLNVVQFLIEHGEDVQSKDEYGNAPLSYALDKEHFKVAEFLIEHGADVQLINNSGDSLIGLASFNGKLETVKFLVKHGANVNLQETCNYGYFPIHSASGQGHYEIAKLLIDNGANVHSRNKYQRTALHLASEKGSLKIVKLLVEHGADIQPEDSDGWTPLNFAIFNNNLDVANYLNSKGAAD